MLSFPSQSLIIDYIYLFDCQSSERIPGKRGQPSCSTHAESAQGAKSAPRTHARAYTHASTPRHEILLARTVPGPSRRGQGARGSSRRAGPPGFPFGTRVPPTAHGRAATLARAMTPAPLLSGVQAIVRAGFITSKRTCCHLAQGTVKRACDSFPLKAQSSVRAAAPPCRCSDPACGQEVMRCA